MMLFHEIYGSYFQILSEILDRAVKGQLQSGDIYEVIRRRGFEETVLTIPEHLKDQSWPLLRPDGTTPLRHGPEMPLTLLEKRWLKALLADPRIRLFDPPTEGLEDVQPLYPADAIVWFDRYNDGDPFEDPAYIARFRTILQAIQENRWLTAEAVNRKGAVQVWRCLPDKLEYSSKDDKFRLLTRGGGTPGVLNLGRLTDCRLGDRAKTVSGPGEQLRYETLVMELTDQRNALERCMLHFSHLEKETERLEDGRYRVTMHYARNDEAELLIRVLSFGQMVKVLEPERMRRNIRTRILRQFGIRDREQTEQA